MDVPRTPARRRGFRHHAAALLLRLGGWTPDGDPPALAKFIVVAAPHTALRDGFWMLALAWWWGLHVDWLVKKEFLRGPLGWWLKRIGAVPVDRSAPQGLVGELTEAFRSRDRMVLAIPPEGTRERRAHWKSGFYQVAREAGVPICLSYLDYGRKRGGFGPCLSTSADVRADMDLIRSFYAGVSACVPEQFTPPRLVEEDEPRGVTGER